MSTKSDDGWREMFYLQGSRLTSFDEAIAVKPSSTNPNIYIADLKRDWCIGLVPHGGYIASLLTHTASQYFADKHSSRDQPDLINLHIEFLSRAPLGAAQIHITPLKLGSQFSNIRVQLVQHEASTSKDRICVEALVIQGNLTKESQNGLLSLPTPPIFEPERLPSRTTFVDPAPNFTPQTKQIAVYKITQLLPPGSTANGLSVSPEGPSVREQWSRWLPANGKRFTVSSLPYLADCFRPVLENYGLTGNWYPTLNYGVDVKRKRMSRDGHKEVGWEWLYVRANITEMRNGRFGIDVVILTEEAEVVCTSRHVALVVNAERNYKGRDTKI